jgi:hypothetical protein
MLALGAGASAAAGAPALQTGRYVQMQQPKLSKYAKHYICSAYDQNKCFGSQRWTWAPNSAAEQKKWLASIQPNFHQVFLKLPLRYQTNLLYLIMAATHPKDHKALSASAYEWFRAAIPHMLEQLKAQLALQVSSALYSDEIMAIISTLIYGILDILPCALVAKCAIHPSFQQGVLTSLKKRLFLNVSALHALDKTSRDYAQVKSLLYWLSMFPIVFELEQTTLAQKRPWFDILVPWVAFVGAFEKTHPVDANPLSPNALDLTLVHVIFEVAETLMLKFRMANEWNSIQQLATVMQPLWPRMVRAQKYTSVRRKLVFFFTYVYFFSQSVWTLLICYNRLNWHPNLIQNTNFAFIPLY